MRSASPVRDPGDHQFRRHHQGRRPHRRGRRSFVLDGMPGKQMAIDADLNAGLINQEEAVRRRQEVTREADFFGAMDGASKFVRGDAVAAVLILFINLVGGLVIGIWQHDLSLAEAAQTTPC